MSREKEKKQSSHTGEMVNCNGPDLVQAFHTKWWVKPDFLFLALDQAQNSKQRSWALLKAAGCFSLWFLNFD